MTAPSHIAPGPATPVAGTAPGAAGGVSGAVGGAPGAGHPAPGIPSPLASGPPSLAVDGSASGGSALNRSPAIAARVAAVLPWLLILLAHAPLMRTAHRLLTERPQYAFWPLVIVAAGFLFWRGAISLTAADRLTASPSSGSKRGDGRVTLLLLAAALGALLFGTTFYFRWFVYPSLWLCLVAAVWHAGGMRALRTFAAPTLLLLAIVPIPSQGYSKLMTLLQTLSVGSATYQIDLLGIAAVKFGNVIEIPGRRLLVQEACSGMNSLLSIVVFAWGFCLVTARSVRFTALILALAAVFMVAANALRITVCAAAYHGAGIDLFEGTAHELISVLLFFAASALVLSARALLALLDLDRPTRLWAWIETRRLPTRAEMSAPVIGVAALLFVTAGALSHWRTRDCWDMSALPEGTLIVPPSTIGEWTLVPATKKDSSLEAIAITVELWRYQNGSNVAEVSLAYPFTLTHGPGGCYVRAGWDCSSSNLQMSVDGAIPFVAVEMRRAHLWGTVISTSCDVHGRFLPVAYPDEVRAQSKIRRLFSAAPIDAHLPARHEIQTLLVQPSPITPEQRASLERLFTGVSRALAEQIRRAAEEAEGAP